MCARTLAANALAAFKSGKCAVLVTTDVAARGLDVKALPFVVNFDMPRNIETYVHRIGRTGRNGMSGVSETFFVAAADGALAGQLRRVLDSCQQSVSKRLRALRWGEE